MKSKLQRALPSLAVIVSILIVITMVGAAGPVKVVDKGAYSIGKTKIVASGQITTAGSKTVFFDIGVSANDKKNNPFVSLGVFGTKVRSIGGIVFDVDNINQIGEKKYYPRAGKVTRYYINAPTEGWTYTCMFNNGGMAGMSWLDWKYQVAKGNKMKKP